MIIDIDMGNSRIKWRFAGGANELCYLDLDGPLPQEWDGLPAGSRFRISSVIAAEKTRLFVHRLQLIAGAVIEVAEVRQSFGGVTLAYSDVSRFGVDRWLALLAARARCPASDCVIVHGGTAFVADFLGSDGQHLGGYIAAGMGISIRALTSAAPGIGSLGVAVPELGRERPGTTTLECVEAGVSLLFRGLMRELQDLASRYLESPVWLFTGGDAESMFVLGKSAAALSIAGVRVSESEIVSALVLDGLAVALP